MIEETTNNSSEEVHYIECGRQNDYVDRPLVYFVPDYLRDAIIVSGLTLEDLTVDNYEKAMGKISTYDMTDMVTMMYYMAKTYTRLSSAGGGRGDYTTWILSYYYELTNRVQNMMSRPIDDAFFVNKGLKLEETYDIVARENAVFVIVKEGFLGYIEKNSNEDIATFSRELINSMFGCYGDSSIIEQSPYFYKLLTLKK